MTTTQDRYSPDLWPNMSLPVPPLEIHGECSLENDWITQPGPPFGGDIVPCPPELHVREFMEVDTHDPSALVAFAGAHGLSSKPWAATAPWYPLFGTTSADPRLLAISAERGWSLKRPTNDAHLTISLAEAALTIELVQKMVKHVDAFQHGSHVEPIWHELDTVSPEVPAMSDDQSASRMAWKAFENYLNRGLSPISARIGAMGSPGPYSSACVLIFNDLVEKAVYRRCADETCGRLFKNQLGRGDGKHSRSDAKYCSPQHARNQSQRETRRRNRADRQEQNHG